MMVLKNELDNQPWHLQSSQVYKTRGNAKIRSVTQLHASLNDRIVDPNYGCLGETHLLVVYL